jgi:hypothetical protein
MMRRLIVALVLVGACASAAWARPRVTIVLRNGERYSGGLVHRYMNEIGVSNGSREQLFRAGEIAVIEFVSGRPSPREIDELPRPERGLPVHSLVLRDGTVVPGRLVDITDDGDLIVIDAGRDRERYAARDIARLYLSVSAARDVYPAARWPPADDRGRFGSGRTPPGAIRVEGRQPWTDTGIEVRRGDRLSFDTTGQIHWGRGEAQVAGPDGGEIEGRFRRNYPVPEMGVGGLIARVENSRPFPIGSNSNPITMPADGILYLGINDDGHGDNSGAFLVRVRRR